MSVILAIENKTLNFSPIHFPDIAFICNRIELKYSK